LIIFVPVYLGNTNVEHEYGLAAGVADGVGEVALA
jgi:hypothetical protein